MDPDIPETADSARGSCLQVDRAREGFHPSYAYTYLATRLAHFLATG